MSRLARRAEILKLARVLGLRESDLDYLQVIDAASIREFRERASARLFDADEHRLRRVAAASKLLPAALNALIAEKVFGPLLCARVAGLIAPERAADLAQRLPVEFLADVTLEIDPRHVREVLTLMPIPRLVDVAVVLARRGEFVTLARFVDYVSLDAIRAVMNRITDNAALLQVAFFVEDKARLESIIEFLPETRLRDIVYLAVDESQDLWSEALSLMSEVGSGMRKRLGEFAASLDESILTKMTRSTQAKGLWSAMLPVIAVMDEPYRKRLLHLQVVQDDSVIDSILAAADSDDLWDLLLPMIPLLDEAGQQRMAGAADRLSDAAFGRILRAVQTAGSWTPMLLLLQSMQAEALNRISPLITKLKPDSVRRIAQEADRMGVPDRLQSLRQLMATWPPDP
ncbi:MAG: hypothetical protein ACT4PZ_17350 [Panacagrimonas sp.]